VSLGGRVILINSVLASIPIFSLSFFKIPVRVRKMIVRIQREFLWGGLSGDMSKIPCVSWKDVCRPKADGGGGNYWWREMHYRNKCLSQNMGWCGIQTSYVQRGTKILYGRRIW
jgi:hypothetical protein